jgi:hypothetical protein
MGATLPRTQRYTDSRFRRVARIFSGLKLNPRDAIELVAFLDLVPYRWARWIFGWKEPFMESVVTRLVEHKPYQRLAAPVIEHNLHGLGYADGLAIMQAMQDGGWTPKWGAPQVVKDAIKEARHRGAKADSFGIPRQVVYRWCSTAKARRRRDHVVAKAALIL